MTIARNRLHAVFSASSEVKIERAIKDGLTDIEYDVMVCQNTNKNQDIARHYVLLFGEIYKRTPDDDKPNTHAKHIDRLISHASMHLDKKDKKRVRDGTYALFNKLEKLRLTHYNVCNDSASKRNASRNVSPP